MFDNSIEFYDNLLYLYYKNKHLPEIPSAENVKENHLNLGKMNNLLLKKVEELTLYIIELQKQVNELKEK